VPNSDFNKLGLFSTAKNKIYPMKGIKSKKYKPINTKNGGVKPPK
jgi:hypothetical protein